MSAPASTAAGDEAPICAVSADATPSIRAALPKMQSLLEAEHVCTWVPQEVADERLRAHPPQELGAVQAGPARSAAILALRSDLLVILRTGARAEPSVEVTVAEPLYGLPLVRKTVPLPADASQVPAALAGPVREAIGRRGRKLEIWAVLAFTHPAAAAAGEGKAAADVPTPEDDSLDSLGNALPLLIQSDLSARPDLAVVEPAEADQMRAVARATKGGDRWPRPTFITGELQHEGDGDARQVSISLVARRAAGDDERHEVERVLAAMVRAADTKALALSTIAAARALCAKVAGDDAAAAAAAAAAPPVDADLQTVSADLAARRDAAIRADDAEAAVAATEAALLLSPDDPALHGLAAEGLSRVSQSNLRIGPDPQLILPSYRAYRRGLGHLEPYLRQGKEVSRSAFVFSFVNGPNGFYPPANAPAWLMDMRHDLMASRREMGMSILRDKVRQDPQSEAVDWALMMAQAKVEPEATKDWYDWLFRVVGEIESLPRAGSRAGMLFIRGRGLDAWDSPEFRAFLDRVASSKNHEVAAAAKAAREYLVAGGTRGGARPFVPSAYGRPSDLPATRPTSGPGTSPSTRPATLLPRRSAATRPAPRDGALPATRPTTAPVGVVFEPVQLDLPDPGPAPRNMVRSGVTVSGITPAGEGIDVLWGGPDLFLMKKKGVLKRAWQPPGPNLSVSAVSFDGKYVWAAVQRFDKPNLLLVLNPVSERVEEFTGEDGLPPDVDFAGGRRGYGSLRVTGVEPGRACVAGGRGTAWLAIVTFSPEAGKRVRVFHEARAQADPGDPNHWRSPYLGFQPGLLVTLTEPARTSRAGGAAATAPAKPARRVLLGRTLAMHEMDPHPLLIDPDEMTVRVVEGESVRGSRPESTVAVHDGNLYWVEPGPTEDGTMQPHLWQLGFPDFAKALVAERVVPARAFNGPSALDKVAFDGERVVIASKDWWLAPAVGESFHELRGNPPDRSDPKQGPPVPAAAAPPAAPPGLPPNAVRTESVIAVRPSNFYGLLVITNTSPAGQRFYEAKIGERPPPGKDDEVKGDK